MKTLILGLIFTFLGGILFAQVDSNKVTNDTMHNNMNNMHNNMNMDSTHNNMKRDSGSMNNNSSVNAANATMDSANNHVNSAVNATNATMDSANNHVNSAVNATNATMDSANNRMNSAVNNMSNTGINSSGMGMAKQPGQLGYLNLPLYKTFVPDDVSSKLKTQYGEGLYSITTIKHTLTDYAYVVRFNKTGQMQTETVDANGTVVANQ